MTRLPPRLIDAEARNRVTTALDRTLFVEAGAGSGKTTSVVNRVVRLVRSGVPVNRIAAITFTEAAATELRHRVRDALEEAGLDQGDQQLVNAAGLVESAAFTTLHGFALRLLADHPVAAGLPPGFTVADEITSLLDFDEQWRLFTGRVGDDLDMLEVQERAAVLGVELRRFVDVARRFDDNWDLLDSVERDTPPLSPLELGPVLEDLITLGALVDNCLDPDDRLARGLTDLAAAATAMTERDPLDQLEWLTSLRWPGRNLGRKQTWTGMEVDAVRRMVAERREAVEAAVDGFRREVIEQYVARVADFVANQVASRQERGELSFHDLLVLARRLLRSDETIRQELHQRYSRLLLDEFQDTDPIQIELAVLLAAEGPVGDRPWQDLAKELNPGRLVVVGDPKQSIYRFRRADIGVYADAEEGLVDEPTRLVSNFRSVPGIVEFVNRMFEVLIGDGEPGAQPPYTPLSAVREPDPSPVIDHPVIVIGGPHDKSVPVGEIREREAADVAGLICRASNEGWRVQRDGVWAPLRLRDVAVLIPSRLSLPALEAAFGAVNLPFRPETTSLVYATQEVRDVLAGVRSVVDPTSSVDVVAALRSSLFAVGDDDLLSWFADGGRWDYRTPAPEELADHPVAEAFTVLAGWHGDRWWLDPSALIERIVTDRRLREAALAEPRPRDRWRRYRFLAEQARQFTATSDGDLADFAAWVEIQSSDFARITEPIPAEPDDDAVRVLTIHGSKGLEFPMVVLAGAPTRDPNRASGPQVLFPRDAKPEVKLGAGRTTPGFDLQASVEEVLDQHERVRLHYVAATRARDLLVVSAHCKEGLRSTGRRTAEALDQCGDGWSRFELAGTERYLVEPPTQLRLADGDFTAVAAEWQTDQDRLLALDEAHRTFSATAMAELLAGRTRRWQDQPGPSPIVLSGIGADSGGSAAASDALGVAELAGPADSGRTMPVEAVDHRAAAVGSAVHATLETIDFAAPSDFEALARFHAEREGVADRGDDVTHLVGTALGAPSIRLARDHPHWRELYVAAPVGTHLIEGYVDLCILTDDGYVVVDYKTDRVDSADEVALKVGFYQYQAATYAVALEINTGEPVVACRFVFVGPEGVIEESVQDLNVLKSRIVSTLR